MCICMYTCIHECIIDFTYAPRVILDQSCIMDYYPTTVLIVHFIIQKLEIFPAWYLVVRA